ncbi:MAG: 50S ribosomal protein L11 methyltransferase [Rhodanobacteraceae bacterium]
MSWLELQLTIDAATQPRAESALEELGASSVTLMDANADTPDEAAIFEPRPGEAPLWQSLTLLALFDADADRNGIVQALRDALPWLAADRIAFGEVADQDWQRAWMDRFHPMQFGRRLWIYPWNVEPPSDDDAVIVRLDPGLAFGTGTHPTTALCLEWLDGIDLESKTVIDYGCGSGVLAIAALKLGATIAIGIDNDPQALTASRDNATRNGVGERLRLHAPDELPDGTRGGVLVANILSEPLHALAPRFAALCNRGASFGLSGILAGQEGELLERYRACGFHDLVSAEREGWIRISGRFGNH